jgi:hypothetical protein
VKRININNEINPKVKDIHQSKNSSEPIKDVDHNLFNDVSNYIFKYGTKLGEKGNRTINNKYIYHNNYRVLINLTFLKNNFGLLERLLNLPVCKRSELFRIAIEKILRHILNHKLP